MKLWEFLAMAWLLCRKFRRRRDWSLWPTRVVFSQRPQSKMLASQKMMVLPWENGGFTMGKWWVYDGEMVVSPQCNEATIPAPRSMLHIHWYNAATIIYPCGKARAFQVGMQRNHVVHHQQHLQRTRGSDIENVTHGRSDRCSLRGRWIAFIPHVCFGGMSTDTPWGLPRARLTQIRG